MYSYHCYLGLLGFHLSDIGLPFPSSLTYFTSMYSLPLFISFYLYVELSECCKIK